MPRMNWCHQFFERNRYRGRVFKWTPSIREASGFASLTLNEAHRRPYASSAGCFLLSSSKSSPPLQNTCSNLGRTERFSALEQKLAVLARFRLSVPAQKLESNFVQTARCLASLVCNFGLDRTAWSSSEFIFFVPVECLLQIFRTALSCSRLENKQGQLAHPHSRKHHDPIEILTAAS